MKNHSNQLRFSSLVFCLVLAAMPLAFSQTTSTLCASASVQLSQNATLDRQAFNATMTITNGLPTSLDNVNVTVNITDASGTQVGNSLFYISSPTIPGTIASGGSPTSISWLIIPTVGAGIAVGGTNYNVGATLSYDVNGQPQTIVVTPAPILVEPLPSLALDYFLPSQVYGLNPLTQQGTPIPFSFGKKGDGHADGLKGSRADGLEDGEVRG